MTDQSRDERAWRPWLLPLCAGLCAKMASGGLGPAEGAPIDDGAVLCVRFGGDASESEGAARSDWGASTLASTARVTVVGDPRAALVGLPGLST